MKRSFLISALVFIAAITSSQTGFFSQYQANYFVSQDGNDNNSGRYPWEPWKTIAKVNASTFIPGDVVAFKRGDSFNGTLTPAQNGTASQPIIFTAYGTSEKPIIYGSEIISGWTLHTGNIYKATFDTEINQLFINGARAKLARYPDNGYFSITGETSNTVFSSADLNGALDYTGATWIGRTSRYTMFARTVTTSSSQTLTIESKVSYNPNTGEGFFM